MTELVLGVIGFLKRFMMFLNPENILIMDIVTNAGSYINTLVDWLEKVNFLVPLPDIFLAYSLMVLFRVLHFALFIVNWLVRRVFDIIP